MDAKIGTLLLFFFIKSFFFSLVNFKLSETFIGFINTISNLKLKSIYNRKKSNRQLNE